MKDLTNLASDISKLNKAIPKAASDATVGKALVTLKRLLQLSPVDSSRMISNWRVSAGFPKTTAISPFFDGDDGDTEEASAAAVMAAAKDALKNKKPGQMIWITNNVPYLDRLRYEALPHWRKPDFGADVEDAIGLDKVKFIWPVM